MARRTLCILFLTCVFQNIARAGYVDLYGFGGRSSALGNAMTASADDFAATYYNPALLTLGKTPSFAVGFSLALPKLQIERALTSGAYEPRSPELAMGITAGLALPLPGRLGERVHLGAVLFMPVGPLIRIRMIDSSVPYFYMYDYQPTTFTLAASLGVRAFDWLRLGLGFHMLATLKGSADIRLDVSNGRFPLRTLDADLMPVVAAIGGIAITPLPGLSFGVSYRGQLGLDIRLPATVTLDGLEGALSLVIGGITQWSPHTFSFGAAYKIPPIPLLLMVDLPYALWSLAPDPSLDVRLDLGGADIDRLGIGDLLDAPTPGNERLLPSNYFSNTLGVRAGAELSPLEWLAIRAGYMYRPTPVPLQTSGTNILDNDTHTLSLGLGGSFPDPFHFFGGRFSVDVTGQLGLLPERRHLKEVTNDPVGDLASGGTIYGASAMLRYQFGP